MENFHQLHSKETFLFIAVLMAKPLAFGSINKDNILPGSNLTSILADNLISLRSLLINFNSKKEKGPVHSISPLSTSD